MNHTDIIGRQTVETISKTKGITKQSAINLISRLKKKRLVSVSGGGRMKRIYTIHALPTEDPNGFYTVVNKYAKKKLIPKYMHYVHGKYSIEDAIIDGLNISDARTKEATMHLFRHVTNWKMLFKKAKRNNKEKDLIKLYKAARTKMRVRKMPARYT
ncbi:hypothetical protein GOV11_01690 [Candidatus Woesearchaeota archaeon]|nr:hypothetical protein [Candidatus Woesearchaeota archaeon]